MAAEVTVELPAVPASVREARSRVASLDGLLPEELPHVQIVVSELVTNAVLHGGGDTVRLTLARDGERYRVEVDDGGRFTASSDSPPPQRPGSPGHGVGLAVVGRLCERWEARGGRVTAWIDLRHLAGR